MNDPHIYHIRPLAQEDAHCLWEMLYQAIHVPQGHEPPAREIVYQPELAYYVAGWGRPGDLGYLAVDAEGLLVGAAWLRLLAGDERGYGWVDDATPELSMAVMPAWRGQGVGSRLLAALLDAAAERYAAVSSSVQADNPALRLYRRLGFEVVEDGGTWYTMRKRLSRAPMHAEEHQPGNPP
jgi:ribosomal protein S18 acetylase RimI-like enzyme